MSIVLDKEYKFYLSNLEEFSRAHLNEFVLIKGKEVAGFFTTYEKALREGLARFGNVSFFIEEVNEEEVHYFHHGINLD